MRFGSQFSFLQVAIQIVGILFVACSAIAMGAEEKDKYPEGDLNQDEIVNGEDIDMIYKALRRSPTDAERKRFDLNQDGKFDEADVDYLVLGPAAIVYGDVNLDGKFDSKDITLVFQVGEYEDNLEKNSTWDTGDFNGDGEFDAADLTFVHDKNEKPIPPIDIEELTPDSKIPPEKNKNGNVFVQREIETTFIDHLLREKGCRVFKTAQGEGVGDLIVTQSTEVAPRVIVVALEVAKDKQDKVTTRKISSRIEYRNLAEVRKVLNAKATSVLEITSPPDFKNVDLKKLVRELF